MKPRAMLLCSLMILAMSAVTAWFYPSLPEVIPTHWNFAGQVDGHGPRWHLWLVGPGLMTGFLLLGAVLPWLSPKQFQVSSFASTYSYLMAVPIVLFAFIEIVMLSSALGGRLDMVRLLPAMVFVVLILVGNQMGKVRRNFFMGIRTPWTLASERVWYATHRLAGKLMVGSGLLGLFAVGLGAPHWLLLTVTLAWALVAVLYSLVCYKQLERAGQL